MPCYIPEKSYRSLFGFTPGRMNWLTGDWRKKSKKGSCIVSYISPCWSLLWMVCIHSDQKESFCSDCFSLRRRARWVIPIGKWSKPLCVKRLLLNRIITFGYVNFHIFQVQYMIRGNKRQEIKTHTHIHTRKE